MPVGNPVVLSVSSCLRLCYNARTVSRSGEGGFQIACFFLFHSRPFYEKRISAEVSADFLGDEWKVSGYVAVTTYHALPEVTSSSVRRKESVSVCLIL